ncbi:MAG: hypothetical protein HY509_00855 [Acidobacteria bacterium]|nr:hypothetical protein [Acidobacteriota bacterium]
MKRKVCLTLMLVVWFAAGAARAEEPDPAEGPEREEILRILRDLEARIRALEDRIRGMQEAGAAVAEIAELQRRIDLLTRELERQKLGEAAGPEGLESRYGLGPAASRVYGVEPGVSIGGYGEGLFESFDTKTDQFDLLRAVLYFGYKFNDRILFNSEIEFEHASTGKGGEASAEFAYLDFLLHPAVNLRSGLLLTPVGFLNELHEPPIFLGARRPDVERVILPTTWRENGAGVFGGFGPFSYRAYLMNGLRASKFKAGTGLRDGRQSGARALAEDFALVGRLDWGPGKGFLLGGSFYRGDSGQGEVGSSGPPLPDAQVTLWDLHTEWKSKGWQFRGLYAEAEVEDTPAIFAATGEGIGEKMVGWYGEAGYDLLSTGRTDQALIPFLRYEEYNTQDEVVAPAASPANDVEVVTFGVGYRPILQVMLKADFQDFENAMGTGADQLNFAVTWLF